MRYGPWRVRALELHSLSNRRMDECIDYAGMDRIADAVQAQIHIFDLDVLKPDFSYHSPR